MFKVAITDDNRQYAEMVGAYLQSKEDIEVVGRKQPCPCGSGKKFKHCCGKNIYYEHTRYVVTPGSIVKLNMF